MKRGHINKHTYFVTTRPTENRKSEKVGNLKKQEILKSRKSENVGSQKKQETGKIRKSGNVRRQKEQEIGKKRRVLQDIIYCPSAVTKCPFERTYFFHIW